MADQVNTLIMGASYGSLLSTKLLLAGHRVKLVCLPEEAALINAEGTRVRLPVRGREGLVEVDSRATPGDLSAATPDAVDPGEYDLVALAMQEPQYRAPGVRELLDKVAKARVPCMSIMNMPPLPYLARIPGLDTASVTHCYTDATVWDSFDPAAITLCSPDPQAFRPPDEPTNVLQVSLPTNFKAARFEGDAPTQMLRRLQADIEGIKFDTGDGVVELPVKLKVHESVFVPLAKWCMLLTGNYRCVQETAARSIRDAVHSDLEASRAVYEWVAELCRKLGADAADQVPFEKYAQAAEGLIKPSSAARALFAGAPNIERVDCLVKTLAGQHGMQLDVVDATVALVDARLAQNRKAAA
ncbi:MAG: 2-dehydropantoate 2-reductase [Alphaproteobacteria bacterium]|nr:2-dehydropantoate 2-reductase [Alphaproteobacteria bacterium]